MPIRNMGPGGVPNANKNFGKPLPKPPRDPNDPYEELEDDWLGPDGNPLTDRRKGAVID